MWYGQSCRGIVHRTALTTPTPYLLELLVAISINVNASRTALLEWYFKIITVQPPPFCLNFTGSQSVSKLISKLQHSCTSHLLLVSPLICLWYYNLISLSGPSAQLTRICYLCRAATAVSDKEVFSYCASKIWNDITHNFIHQSKADTKYRYVLEKKKIYTNKK